MATAKERLTIFENVIARIGLDGDVLGEYSRAMSMLNNLKSYQELMPQQPTIQDVQPPQPTEPTPAAPTNPTEGMATPQEQIPM